MRYNATVVGYVNNNLSICQKAENRLLGRVVASPFPSTKSILILLVMTSVQKQMMKNYLAE
jgi:hypothetical protein